MKTENSGDERSENVTNNSQISWAEDAYLENTHANYFKP